MACSPIGLGAVPSALSAAAARYVYVASLDQWWDVHTQETFSPRAMDRFLGHELKSASNELTAWKRTARAVRLDYLPGVRRLITTNEQGVVVANRWTPSKMSPKPGDWLHIEKLLEGLFPKDDQRAHFLDIAGFVVQNPGQKVLHSVMLCGVPGSGKSTIGKLLGRMVGEHNSRTIEGRTLAGRWNADLTDTVLALVEEVTHGDRREVTESLKTMITERRVSVETKGRDFAPRRTFDLAIMCSNDRQPLALAPEDRRIWMPDFIETAPTHEFWNAFHENLDAELPAFFGFLLERSVESFNPNRSPPMTQAKEAAIEDSRSTAEAEILSMLRDRRGPFVADVVIAEMVADELRHLGHRNLNPAWAGRLLRRLGAASCNRQLPKGGNKDPWVGEPRVLAVRNQQSWVDATSTTLRDEVRRGLRSQAASEQSVSQSDR